MLVCDTAAMRIVTPEQRQRRAKADRTLVAAVAKYLRLERQAKEARDDLYRKIFAADQAGMRQIDIVDRTVGLGTAPDKPFTREHIRRIVDRVAEEMAETGVAAATAEDDDIEHSAAS